jgi:predicted transcriptional regulator of viral defense system
LHGATHQAVMEFQVITNKRLPQLRIGRSNIVFYYRKNLGPIAAGIVERKTDTGHMKVSSPELTALDLLRYPHAGGGLDNIATVIADLAEHLNAGKLATLAAAYERSVSQRLGYLLDLFGRSERAGALHRMLTKRSTVPWVELEPSLTIDTDLVPQRPQDRNERWHVIVRRLPERDE